MKKQNKIKQYNKNKPGKTVHKRRTKERNYHMKWRGMLCTAAAYPLNKLDICRLRRQRTEIIPHRIKNTLSFILREHPVEFDTFIFCPQKTQSKPRRDITAAVFRLFELNSPLGIREILWNVLVSHLETTPPPTRSTPPCLPSRSIWAWTKMQ